MAISIFGTYFSAKFVTVGLAKELFLEKVTNNQDNGTGQPKV